MKMPFFEIETVAGPPDSHGERGILTIYTCTDPAIARFELYELKIVDRNGHCLWHLGGDHETLFLDSRKASTNELHELRAAIGNCKIDNEGWLDTFIHASEAEDRACALEDAIAWNSEDQP